MVSLSRRHSVVLSWVDSDAWLKWSHHLQRLTHVFHKIVLHDLSLSLSRPNAGTGGQAWKMVVRDLESDHIGSSSTGKTSR